MRRRMLAVLAGLLAFSLATATAASLGGINTTDLGADTAVVASCDTDGINVDFTTSFDNGSYRVDSVELSDVDAACDGQDVEVTLYDLAGDPLGSGSAVADDSGTLSVPMTGDPEAEEVEGVAVVIAG